MKEEQAAINYLKSNGFKLNSDLNYTTNHSSINFYLGVKKDIAGISAIIEDNNNYMLLKQDLREMSETARQAGINKIVLYTNYGCEVKSSEGAKSVGLTKIVKLTRDDFGLEYDEE